MQRHQQMHRSAADDTQLLCRTIQVGGFYRNTDEAVLEYEFSTANDSSPALSKHRYSHLRIKRPATSITSVRRRILETLIHRDRVGRSRASLTNQIQILKKVSVAAVGHPDTLDTFHLIESRGESTD